jgi:hypothetical protein
MALNLMDFLVKQRATVTLGCAGEHELVGVYGQCQNGQGAEGNG